MKRKYACRLVYIILISALLASALAGCGGKGAGIPYEENMKSYTSVIESLPEGSYYAFADMSPKHDALLVTEHVFDNMDGTLAAIEATVYCFDKDGNIKEYGQVESGGTANPLAAKDSELYCAHHLYIDKVHIDVAESKMLTVESHDFEAYGDSVVIAFRPVSIEAESPDAAEPQT